MKQKTEMAITLAFVIDGKVQELQFPIEQLRNWINGQKIKSGQQTVTLDFNIEGKHYSKDIDVNIDFAEIKHAVKYAELLTNIIPMFLSNYLVDITQKLSKKQSSFKVIGREHEIEKAWFYLSQKRRNNVFLIGEHDVGKTAIAFEIARRISVNDCPRELYDKHVLMLKPEQLLNIEHEFLYKLKVNQLVSFLAKNKEKLILFIDKAVYMKADISLIYILYACLKKYNIPLLVTSSEDNFEDYFYEDQSIAKYINYIGVEEPELNEVGPMVHQHIVKLQKQYGIAISDKMIKYAIFTSELSSSVSANPGKVINILERAFLTAKRKDKEEVDKQCILSCYDSRIKDYSKMPKEEKRSTAYHEAGHYILVVKSSYRKNVKISCVSNLPTNWWCGVTMSYYDKSKYSVSSKDFFLDYIAMCLAGRIAEKKFTHLNSTGASSDLEHASNIAKAMVMKWGFSEDPSNLNRQYDYSDYYLMPESKKKTIDDEIQKLIDAGTKRAEKIIDENEDLLKIIAEKLLIEEILTGEELEAICKEYDQSKS